MAIDKQQLILELKAKGITLTKTQLKQLDGQVKASKAGMIAMGAAIAAATVAIVALAKTVSHAVRVGKEFEQSMANLKAISGASNTELLKLEDTAKKLGASTKFTASQVGGLQTEFAKLGFSTKEIQNATGATLALASATGADLGEAAAIAGTTVRAFQLDTAETTRVSDVMAKSFSSSALDMQKFTDSMTYVAPIAKMAGVSIEGTTAMLGALADAGISGSMAGTQLRKILLEAGQAGTKLAKRLGGPITSAEDFQKKLKKLIEEGFDPMAEAEDLVGTRAVAAFGILLNSVDTVDSLTEALERSAGAAQAMADIQLDTLEGKLTILNSAWEGFGIALYDYFEEPLKSAADSLTEFVQSMTGAIEIPLAEKMAETRYEAMGLVKAMNDTNLSLEQQQVLANKLNIEFPEVAEKYREMETAGEDLDVIIKAISDSMLNQMIIATAQEEIEDVITRQGEAWIDTYDNTQKAESAFYKLKEALGLTADSTLSNAEVMDLYSKKVHESTQLISINGARVKKIRGEEGSQLIALYDEYARYAGQAHLSSEKQETLEKTGKLLEERLNAIKKALGFVNEEMEEMDGYSEDPTWGLGGTGGGGGAGDVAPQYNWVQRLFGAREEDADPDVLMDQIADTIDQVTALMDQYAQANIQRAISEANARIAEINRLENRELSALKNSRKYKIMSDKAKLEAEQKIIDKHNAMKKAEKAAANKIIEENFKIQQASSIAQIMMATGEAWMNAVKMFPPLGTPWTFIAAAMGAAQVALVLSQKPPTMMAQGGLIGGNLHDAGGTPLIAERGEFIMNRDAVENAGIDAMENINAGGGQPIQISFTGNILSDDFIANEAVPRLKEALRRGGDLGIG